MRKELVNEVVRYFSGPHWARLVEFLHDHDVAHIHSYIDTSLSADTLETLIVSYLGKRGWVNGRKIDHMSPKEGIGALHGIQPLHMPHFDVMWRFNPSVVLAPMDGGERGQNLLAWDTRYMAEFLKKFPFREFGEAEREQLGNYFTSAHWRKGLEVVVAPGNLHVHINTRAGVHPEHIRKAGVRALTDAGWTVSEAVHCVYDVHGEYRGKIVFLCLYPMRVFDIAWKFDPAVVLAPATETYVWPKSVDYDVWDQPMLDACTKEKFVAMTYEEVMAAIDAVCGK